MIQRPPALRRSLIVAVAFALLLAACGNSGDKKTTSSSTGGGSSSGSSAASSSADTTTKVPVDAPGVTDTEIRFAALGTNSNNPLGTCVLDCFDNGVRSYFAWRNSQGGIYGRQLTLTKEVDDELANNQAKALDMLSANDFFGMFSATQFPSGWGDIAGQGVPLYTWSIFPDESNGKESIFGYSGEICTKCTSRATAFDAKTAGAKKIATLGYGISNNSKECANANKASIEKYSANIGGAQVVYVNDNLDFGLPNGIGPEVSAMKAAGVDTIMSCIDLNGQKTLAQELQRQGMRQSVKIIHPNTYDQKFVQDAGGLFAGDYVSVGFRPFEADPGTSQLKDFREWMGKAGKAETELAMIGWINADLAYQGLVAAGPQFDRAKVISATNTKLTAYTAGGLVAPIDWSRQHVVPKEGDTGQNGAAQDCVQLVQIGQDSKFTLVGDKTKPFNCWPGNTDAWSEPTPTNFE